MKRGLLLFLVLVSTKVCFAYQPEIAITIDDLPFVGESKNFHLQKIIDAALANEITLTGFVIAGNVRPNNWPVLKKFREAGFALGNHTMSHLNLNKVTTETYLHEIGNADKILNSLLSEPKYFRYPYLAMGEGNKKERVKQYLTQNHYHVAPITIDSKDFIFNQLLLAVPEKKRRDFLPSLKTSYLAFIWQQTLAAQERNNNPHNPEKAQILLIHANLLNAYVLDDIIHLYKHNGFSFVSLDKALAPRLPDSIKKSPKSVENYLEWD